MKRWFALLAAGLLALSLAACGSDEPPLSGGTTDGGTKIGVGSVSSLALEGKEKTYVKATVAGVLLDKDGKILSCELDEAEFPVTLKDGVMAEAAKFMTKAEMGDDYILTDRDHGAGGTAGASWEDQVDAFCDYVEGKTGAEVAAIAATDGKSEEIKGCDLIITDFILAVKRATEAAISKKAAREDDLHLAVTVSRSGEGTDKKPQYDIEMAAVTLDESDRITACMTDTAQAKLAVEGSAFVHESGALVSKRAAGEGYNMKPASSVKKEWYEQADAFDAYAVGKTAESLSNTTLKDDKADAISGCTIKVGGMLKNAVKAARD